MNQDIRIKAYNKYHRRRWFKYSHYIFNFEYRITGVDFEEFYFGNKITFNIEIRDITPDLRGVTDDNFVYFDRAFRMYIDKESGRPKRKKVKGLNFRIRQSSGLENSFINMAEGFGIVPPSVMMDNIYQIGKIKYK